MQGVATMSMSSNNARGQQQHAKLSPKFVPRQSLILEVGDSTDLHRGLRAMELALDDSHPFNAPKTLEPDPLLGRPGLKVWFDSRIEEHDYDVTDREWYSEAELDEFRVTSSEDEARADGCWRGLEHVQMSVDKDRNIKLHVQSVKIKQITLLRKQMKDNNFDAAEELRNFSRISTKETRRQAKALAEEDAKFCRRQARAEKKRLEAEEEERKRAERVSILRNPIAVTNQVVSAVVDVKDNTTKMVSDTFTGATNVATTVSGAVVGATTNTAHMVSGAVVGATDGAANMVFGAVNGATAVTSNASKRVSTAVSGATNNATRMVSGKFMGAKSATSSATKTASNAFFGASRLVSSAVTAPMRGASAAINSVA